MNLSDWATLERICGLDSAAPSHLLHFLATPVGLVALERMPAIIEQADVIPRLL